MIDLLKRLMFTSGVSGREDKIRELIAKEVEPYADEVSVDNMGNLIARKKGNGKKIMFCAHMDEIGFFVTNITSSGNLNVSPVGGINLLATTFGEVVSENGVYGALIPTNKSGLPKSDEVCIDIGAKNKKQAEKKVSVGDYFVAVPQLRKLLGTRYIGRPFDDRVGCAVLIEALKQANNCENDLYFVFSVQEEVGSRGAKPAAYSISPDIAIALDVTATGDKPAAPKMEVKLGAGCAIKIKDPSTICHIDLVKQMRAFATENKIKYQDEILPFGGTDASAMQSVGTGAKTGVISIPSAFIHSSVEMIDLNDVKEAVKLTVALCKGL